MNPNNYHPTQDPVFWGFIITAIALIVLAYLAHRSAKAKALERRESDSIATWLGSERKNRHIWRH